jgi:hypothetical protein
MVDRLVVNDKKHKYKTKYCMYCMYHPESLEMSLPVQLLVLLSAQENLAFGLAKCPVTLREDIVIYLV